MPARSKAQFRYIQMLRERYGSEKDTPEEHKWVWEGDWTHGVNFGKLPEKSEMDKEAAANPEQLARMRDLVERIFGMTDRLAGADAKDAALVRSNLMGGATMSQVSPTLWKKSPDLQAQFSKPPSFGVLRKWLPMN